MSRRPFEQTVETHPRRQRSAVYFEKIVAFSHVDSRRTERRPQIRIPILTGIDPCDAVVPILNGKIRAQQADGDALLGRLVAFAAEIGVSYRQVAANHGDEITQIRTMADVGQQRVVLVIDRLPIVAMHLGVVEEFALDPPGLTIDLRPFGAGIDLHLELRNVDRAVANFGWLIGWDDSPAAFGASAARLIEQLLLVRGKRVEANAFQERRGNPGLELITLQP